MVATTNDPHLLALAQIEADKATGRISPEQYEKAKAELTAKHVAATRPWRMVLYAAVLVPVLLVAGCVALLAGGSKGSNESSTSGYQTAVRKMCADQVRNGIGQASFREQSETSSAQPDGSTKYVATGRADVAGRSVRYTCEGTVAADADKTLTVRLVSAS